jgi:molybdate transport system substrate-binding protein
MGSKQPRPRRRPVQYALAIALVAAFLSVAAGAAARVDAGGGAARLKIFAAASLTQTFPKIDKRPIYSFAGSDTLYAQITQGADVDVYAAASPKYPQQLFKDGLCEAPRTFAYNKIVVIVPKSNPAGIHSVFGLKHSGIKLVIGQTGVPIGDYTRQILRNLGISKAVLANVVSQAPDVKTITTQVALGQADAGIVYRTDVVPVSDKVTFFRFPAWSQPPVRYQICVLTHSSNKAAARAFVARVLGPIGRGQLSGALFGLPPKS